MSSIACAFCAQADRQREHLFICLHQRTHTHTTLNLCELCACVCPLPQVIQHEKSQIQGEDNIFSLLFQSKRLHFRTRRQKSIIKSNQPGNENLHLTAFDLKVYLLHSPERSAHLLAPEPSTGYQSCVWWKTCFHGPLGYWARTCAKSEIKALKGAPRRHLPARITPIYHPLMVACCTRELP